MLGGKHKKKYFLMYKNADGMIWKVQKVCAEKKNAYKKIIES